MTPANPSSVPKVGAPSGSEAAGGDTLQLYRDFLSGKIIVETRDGTFTLKDAFQFEKPEDIKYNEYAYFDINKDGMPELLLNSGGPLTILTVKDNKLLLVGGGYNDTVLSNGSVLMTRNGGAPTHIDYDYITFDMNGNQTDLYFSVYKNNNRVDDGQYSFDQDDVYIFSDKTVSKAEWDSLTKPYFAIPSAVINWESYEDEKTASCVSSS